MLQAVQSRLIQRILFSSLFACQKKQNQKNENQFSIHKHIILKYNCPDWWKRFCQTNQDIIIQFFPLSINKILKLFSCYCQYVICIPLNLIAPQEFKNAAKRFLSCPITKIEFMKSSTKDHSRGDQFFHYSKKTSKDPRDYPCGHIAQLIFINWSWIILFIWLCEPSLVFYNIIMFCIAVREVFLICHFKSVKKGFALSIQGLCVFNFSHSWKKIFQFTKHSKMN